MSPMTYGEDYSVSLPMCAAYTPLITAPPSSKETSVFLPLVEQPVINRQYFSTLSHPALHLHFTPDVLNWPTVTEVHDTACRHRSWPECRSVPREMVHCLSPHYSRGIALSSIISETPSILDKNPAPSWDLLLNRTVFIRLKCFRAKESLIGKICAVVDGCCSVSGL